MQNLGVETYVRVATTLSYTYPGEMSRWQSLYKKHLKVD